MLPHKWNGTVLRLLEELSLSVGAFLWALWHVVMEAAFPSTKPCGLHSTGSSWPPCVLAILQRGKWRLQAPRATQGVQESRTFYHEVLGAGASQTPAPMPPFPSQEGRTPSLSALLPPHRGSSPLGLSQGHPFPAKSGQLRCGLCGWRGRSTGEEGEQICPQDPAGPLSILTAFRASLSS